MWNCQTLLLSIYWLSLSAKSTSGGQKITMVSKEIKIANDKDIKWSKCKIQLKYACAKVNRVEQGKKNNL